MTVADFTLVGALDATTASRVRAELTDLLLAGGGPAAQSGPDAQGGQGGQGSGRDLVVDLERLGAFDAVGLGLLLGIHRQAQRCGRRLVLTGVQPRVMRVFAVTRLRRVLAIDEPASTRWNPQVGPTAVADQALASQ
jgi:anti-anti-sigma regulatory factor